MKESKAVYVTKRDLRKNLLDRDYQLYSNKAYQLQESVKYGRKSKEVAVQYNWKRDNIMCTCKNLIGLKKQPDPGYYSGNRQIVKSSSFTDIGVGSVKALPKKKVRRIHLPETDERGVGSTDLSSYIVRKNRIVTGHSFCYQNRTSSKCVGGLVETYTESVVSAQVSPIDFTKSGTCSPKEPVPACISTTKEIGSNVEQKPKDVTIAQIGTDDIAGDKESPRSIQCNNTSYSKKASQNSKHKAETATSADKSQGDRNMLQEKSFSSDSLVQHVHNLEIRDKDILSVDMENSLDETYNQMFNVRSTEIQPEVSMTDKKTSSVLRRRFEALRRTLGKKNESKDDCKKGVILLETNKSKSSQNSETSRRDASITSDPPSLEGHSYSSFTKPGGAYQPNQSKLYQKASYKKSYTGNKKGNDQKMTKFELDSEYDQSVKGMFKLWGSKFNLDEDNPDEKQSESPTQLIVNAVPKVGTATEQKKGKKFFFFKRKNVKVKDKPKEMFKQKKEITTGRCEVRDGLSLKIGGNNNTSATTKIKRTKIPPAESIEELLRKSWLLKFLSNPIESRNSVQVRWNNRTYTTSSSTVFELMENVYKETGVVFRSKSELMTDDSCYYRPFTNQRVNFVQNVEAWMIPKTITNDPITLKNNKYQRKKDTKNIEVSISDQKWFIDKSQAFANKIEVVLHSNNFVKLDNRDANSEYLKIDIPKGFFSDDTSSESPQENTSDEEVYKIVEYDSFKTNSEIKKMKKRDQGLDTGEHAAKDIKVTISVKDKHHEAHILDTVISRSNMQRDVVTQGSSVFIPKKCDVIGVGIITQRDVPLKIIRPKSVFKILEYETDDESESTIHSTPKKFDYAESFLQDYYKNCAPLAVDLFPWCVSDSHVQGCSDNNSNSSFNNGDGSKSCPNIGEDYSHMRDQSFGNLSSSEICVTTAAAQLAQNDNYNKNAQKKGDREHDPNRVLPKDSLEVFKKRQMYVHSNKSKWKSNTSSTQSACLENTGDHDRKNRDSNSIGDTDRKERSNEKHVSMDTDIETPKCGPRQNLAVTPGILSYGRCCGSCDAKRDTQKHAKIDSKVHEIDVPKCKDDADKCKASLVSERPRKKSCQRDSCTNIECTARKPASKSPSSTSPCYTPLQPPNIFRSSEGSPHRSLESDGQKSPNRSPNESPQKSSHSGCLRVPNEETSSSSKDSKNKEKGNGKCDPKQKDKKRRRDKEEKGKAKETTSVYECYRSSKSDIVHKANKNKNNDKNNQIHDKSNVDEKDEFRDSCCRKSSGSDSNTNKGRNNNSNKGDNDQNKQIHDKSNIDEKVEFRDSCCRKSSGSDSNTDRGRNNNNKGDEKIVTNYHEIESRNSCCRKSSGSDSNTDRGRNSNNKGDEKILTNYHEIESRNSCCRKSSGSDSNTDRGRNNNNNNKVDNDQNKQIHDKSNVDEKDEFRESRESSGSDSHTEKGKNSNNKGDNDQNKQIHDKSNVDEKVEFRESRESSGSDSNTDKGKNSNNKGDNDQNKQIHDKSNVDEKVEFRESSEYSGSDSNTDKGRNNNNKVDEKIVRNVYKIMDRSTQTSEKFGSNKNQSDPACIKSIFSKISNTERKQEKNDDRRKNEEEKSRISSHNCGPLPSCCPSPCGNSKSPSACPARPKTKPCPATLPNPAPCPAFPVPKPPKENKKKKNKPKSPCPCSPPELIGLLGPKYAPKPNYPESPKPTNPNFPESSKPTNPNFPESPSPKSGILKFILRKPQQKSHSPCSESPKPNRPGSPKYCGEGKQQHPEKYSSHPESPTQTSGSTEDPLKSNKRRPEKPSPSGDKCEHCKSPHCPFNCPLAHDSMGKRSESPKPNRPGSPKYCGEGKQQHPEKYSSHPESPKQTSGSTEDPLKSNKRRPEKPSPSGDKCEHCKSPHCPFNCPLAHNSMGKNAESPKPNRPGSPKYCGEGKQQHPENYSSHPESPKRTSGSTKDPLKCNEHPEKPSPSGDKCEHCKSPNCPFSCPLAHNSMAKSSESPKPNRPGSPKYCGEGKQQHPEKYSSHPESPKQTSGSTEDPLKSNKRRPEKPSPSGDKCEHCKSPNCAFNCPLAHNSMTKSSESPKLNRPGSPKYCGEGKQQHPEKPSSHPESPKQKRVTTRGSSDCYEPKEDSVKTSMTSADSCGHCKPECPPPVKPSSPPPTDKSKPKSNKRSPRKHSPQQVSAQQCSHVIISSEPSIEQRSHGSRPPQQCCTNVATRSEQYTMPMPDCQPSECFKGPRMSVMTKGPRRSVMTTTISHCNLTPCKNVPPPPPPPPPPKPKVQPRLDCSGCPTTPCYKPTQAELDALKCIPKNKCVDKCPYSRSPVHSPPLPPELDALKCKPKIECVDKCPYTPVHSPPRSPTHSNKSDLDSSGPIMLSCPPMPPCGANPSKLRSPHKSRSPPKSKSPPKFRSPDRAYKAVPPVPRAPPPTECKSSKTSYSRGVGTDRGRCNHTQTPRSKLSVCDRDCSSRGLISGIHLKQKPRKKTCGSDCSAWDKVGRSAIQSNVFRINSQENVTIKLRKDSQSYEEIRDPNRVTVKDADGDTLYEREDRQQSSQKWSETECQQSVRDPLVSDLYRHSNCNRLSADPIIVDQVDEIRSSEKNSGEDETSSASVANLIEINLKLKLGQGDKTTELNTSNEGNIHKSPKKSQLGNLSQEVFVMKDGKDFEGKDSVNTKDINIRILVKNFKTDKIKPKTKQFLPSHDDFSTKISNKFQTVSTGYDMGYDYRDEISETEPILSVHRATIDLTNSESKALCKRSSDVSKTEPNNKISVELNGGNETIAPPNYLHYPHYKTPVLQRLASEDGELLSDQPKIIHTESNTNQLKTADKDSKDSQVSHIESESLEIKVNESKTQATQLKVERTLSNSDEEKSKTPDIVTEPVTYGPKTSSYIVREKIEVNSKELTQSGEMVQSRYDEKNKNAIASGDSTTVTVDSKIKITKSEVQKLYISKSNQGNIDIQYDFNTSLCHKTSDDRNDLENRPSGEPNYLENILSTEVNLGEKTSNEPTTRSSRGNRPESGKISRNSTLPHISTYTSEDRFDLGDKTSDDPTELPTSNGPSDLENKSSLDSCLNKNKKYYDVENKSSEDNNLIKQLNALPSEGGLDTCLNINKKYYDVENKSSEDNNLIKKLNALPSEGDTQKEDEKAINELIHSDFQIMELGKKEKCKDKAKGSCCKKIMKKSYQDERKEMLKQVFEHGEKYLHKPKTRTRIQRLKQMLKAILTSDSSEPDELVVPSNELAKDITYNSVKPTFFRNSDSLNNYLVSSMPSENNSDGQPKYHTTEEFNSNCSAKDSDGWSIDDGRRDHTGCMCTTFASRLKSKLCNDDFADTAGCCCRKKAKVNQETICDLHSEDEYFSLNYKIADVINAETQNTRCNSTTISIGSEDESIPEVVANVEDLEKESLENIAEEVVAQVMEPDTLVSIQQVIRSSKTLSKPFTPRTSYTKKETNTRLGISDDDKIVFLETKSTKYSAVPNYRKPSHKKHKHRHKERCKISKPADILQLYETKKAVLEIYAEKTNREDGPHTVAKLPKFILDTDIQINHMTECLERNNQCQQYCKRNIVMMSFGR